MALKAALATLDGVEEALKAQYKKADDGKYYLDVEGVDDMPAVAGLKSKNTELLTEKKAVQAKLEAFGDMTPEKLEELRKAAKAVDGKDIGKLREEYEAKLTAVQQEALREKEKATKESEAAQRAAENFFLDSQVTSALTAAKGVPELLAPVMRGKVKAVREGETFKLVVLDANGQPRIKDSAGNPFGASDLVAELKNDPKYGRAFEPDGNAGSGAERTSTEPLSTGTVSASDSAAIGANLEAIVSGKVTVQ